MKPNILLISTVVSRNLHRAIKDVSDYTNVKLIFAHDFPKKSTLQKYVDWADIILMDVRGDPLSLTELNYKNKDVVALVGGSPSILSLAKLGKFKMSKIMKSDKCTMSYGNPESMMKWIKRIQKIIEFLGKFLPITVLKDARNYIKILKYWANGGYNNYKNMFLHICKLKGLDVEVEDPIEYPEFGLYHPVYGDKIKISPDKPTVGVIYYGGMHRDASLPLLEEICKKLDCNIIPVYTDGIRNLEAMKKYFKDKQLDGIISLLWFKLNGGPLGGDSKPTIEFLKNIDSKLFTPSLMLMQEIKDWRKNKRGLSPLQTITSVTLPETDGGVESIPLCGVKNYEVVPIEDRVDKFVKRVENWLKLKRKNNEEKKIAIIIYNYPPGEENLGNAAYLDTFASLEKILKILKKNGYKVEVKNRKELEKLFIKRRLFNSEIIYECPKLNVEEYLKYFNKLPDEVKKDVINTWGPPPGDILVDKNKFLIPGVTLGNVFIGVQPSRPPLSNEDIDSAIHDDTKPPHHQYIAFYKWIENVFKADCVIHLGTHGTAEFTKGKEIGLSSKCFPDILIGNMPNVYIYHIINTSEASIAKRRLYGTLISYNSPPYTTAGSYGKYAKLEDLLDEYREAKGKDKIRAKIAKEKALKLAKKLHLGEDLNQLERKLYEYRRSIIPKGLHVVGEKYELKQKDLIELITAIARYDRGSVKSLHRLIAERMGLKYEKVLNNPRILRKIDKKAKKLVKQYLNNKKLPKDIKETIDYCVKRVKNFVDNSLELKNLIKSLNGSYIEPSVGGDVIRNPEVLPTGKNIHEFDPQKIPTEAAIERGKRIAKLTIENYFKKHGKYPETVGVVLWGFETAKTQGETIAQILDYLGVKIIHKTPWEKKLKVIPIEKLKRPRIDVVVTICGFFREMFPNLMELLDRAFRMVAELPESKNENFVKKHVTELEEHGDLAKARIFGPQSTEYNTRLLELVEDSAWKNENDLAEAYIHSMSYAYTKNHYSKKAQEVFEKLLKNVDLISQVRDSHDYEITDLDHYYEFFGGLSKSVEILRDGKKPEMLIADSTKEIPKVEKIDDSIKRGSITRTLNPKWINAMLKHGFSGVQKIADRVEYLLGLSATTNAVDNWIWDEAVNTFIFDEKMYRKLEKNNKYATKKMLERFLEAYERGYWKSDEKTIKKLKNKYMNLDAELEGEL